MPESAAPVTPAPAAATSTPVALSGMIASIETEERWYYQPKNTYWVKADENQDSSDWVSIGPPTFELELLRRGFPDRMTEAGIKAWQAEKLFTEKSRRVDYAGPLAGWKKGLVRFGDTRALITKSPALPEPREGTYDTLTGLMHAILRGPEEDGTLCDQTPYFLAWWRHALLSLYAGQPRNGLCLAVAGEPGSGKTLLKDLVKRSFGGREVLPYKWMIGDDNFNHQLVEAPLWTVDDEGSSTRHEDRLQLLSNIKQIVANSGLAFRDMHKTAITLAPFRRLFFCLNIEPDRLMVLPPMDPDIEGKMMILKAYRQPYPMPTGTDAEYNALIEKLHEELPCLIHDLLRTPIIGFEEGRFGVKTFHHPQIMRELSDVGPEIQVLDFLDRLAARPDNSTAPTWVADAEDEWRPRWKGTATELRLLLLGDDSPLSVFEKKEVPKPMWLGRRLEKLEKRFPLRFIRKRTARNNFWIIFKEDPAIKIRGGMEA